MKRLGELKINIITVIKGIIKILKWRRKHKIESHVYKNDS